MAQVAVDLGRQAARDLRRLHPDDRRATLRAMNNLLTQDPLPANTNDRALKGRAPWRRLRVGELRILWRPVGNGDRRHVARVIHRRDLERAVRALGD